MSDSAKLDPKILAERQVKLAMQSPAHLKQWAKASGRTWIVINADELIDALPWPGGVQEFMDLITLLAKQRATKPTGRFDEVKDPLTQEMISIPVMKTEELEMDELDRAIRFLVGQIREHRADWSLDDPAL